MIVTYKEVVDTVQLAADTHLAIQSFAEGPISIWIVTGKLSS